MQQNNNVLFNLLDSHDTERLMNRFHDLDIFYQQLAVLFTLPGSPCIYYGTEIAMEGGFDPDCRRCMPWDEIHTTGESGADRVHEGTDPAASDGRGVQESAFPFFRTGIRAAGAWITSRSVRRGTGWKLC